MLTERVHSIETLSGLFKLNEYDIERILLKEGKPCFSADEDCFMVFIPSLGVFARYDQKRHDSLKTKLAPGSFNITWEQSLLKISQPGFFSSSFLLTDFFHDQIETFMDITEDTCFLLSDRLDVPLFVGNKNVVLRLADDFDGDNSVVSVKNFTEWKAYNV